MGAEIRYGTSSGRTMMEAWDSLVEEDREENGSGHYNSVFSSIVNGIKEVDKFPDEPIDKYTAVAVCIQKPIANTNKTKTEVENFPCKATRKWVTEYYGTTWRGERISEISSDSQTKCIALARKYVEKNPHVTVEIHIGKKLAGAVTKVASIKYKKSTKERIGKWEFMACVAC